jgi:hypothetical protein
VTGEGNPVGAEVSALDTGEPGVLTAVSADGRHAAAPVRHVDVTRRRGEDAFGPVQVAAERLQERGTFGGHRATSIPDQAPLFASVVGVY